MADNKFPYAQGGCRDTVCIEANRVLDSCRDRDCFENVRVYLSDFGDQILESTGSIRMKSATIIGTHIGIDPVQFNRGFYSVLIRFYVHVVCEACIGCGKAQELNGISVLEKRVILYGGENNSSVFRSSPDTDGFCSIPELNGGEKNTPTAVVEVVEPILLGTKIMEKVSDCNCCCCCQSNELPERVLTRLDGPVHFDDDDENHHGKKYLTVSLGIFSVVRITRPAQYLIQATEYAIPEKECMPVEEDDPCGVFRSMPFPINEFTTQGTTTPNGHDRPTRCGCGNS